MSELSRQVRDFGQRIAAGDEIESALLPCEETLEFLHRIDGKRAGLRLQFDHRRDKRRDAGDGEAHHGVSVYKRDQAFTKLVRGLRWRLRNILWRLEKYSADAFRYVQVPEMNRV